MADDYSPGGGGSHPMADDYSPSGGDDDDVMKEDYVVTSLDDPDVSQRFFAAIDNLLLQDYAAGSGEDFGARESEKGGEYHCQLYTVPCFSMCKHRKTLKIRPKYHSVCKAE